MKGPSDLMFLKEDPRPDLADDSYRWKTLFWLIPNRLEKEKAEPLSIIMWELRAFGVEMRRNSRGLYFVPLFGDGGFPGDMDYYNEIKGKYMRPFGQEIAALLAELQTTVD